MKLYNFYFCKSFHISYRGYNTLEESSIVNGEQKTLEEILQLAKAITQFGLMSTPEYEKFEQQVMERKVEDSQAENKKTTDEEDVPF